LKDIVLTSTIAKIVRRNYKSFTRTVFGTQEDEQARRTVEVMRKADIDFFMTLIEGELHLFDMPRNPDEGRCETIQPACRSILKT
jgi:hypothetical protein